VLRLLFSGLMTVLMCSTALFAAQSWVYVCTDAGIGGYQAFPDVCRLQDGRLLCVFDAGYGHVSYPNEQLPKGGRIVGCFSSDEGKTWTDPVIVVDTPLADMDASVVQLVDGRILCVYYTYERWHKDGNVNVRIGTAIVESADNGKTWSEPRFLFQDYPFSVPVSQPIRVLSDGTLLMPLYTHDEKDTRTNSGAVSLSDDLGKTWSDVIIIPNGGRQYDAETDVIELKDGTLYAIQRHQSHSMGVSWSKDKGKTWSVSEEVGFPGHCPYLFRTKDDVILLGIRTPKVPETVFHPFPVKSAEGLVYPSAFTGLRISRDECKTWSEIIEVDDVGGAYPSMVGLKDGSILIVYYEEGVDGRAPSCIRAKKFKVTETGVEWLPFE